MRRLLIAAMIAALWPPGPAQAKIGLSARFGDVILESAQPGRTYNLREAARVPFGVENRGDAQTEVVVEFEKPRKDRLAEGYEAIPDPTWMKAMPDRLTLGPKAVGFFDLLLTIPDDPALTGRHFQVTVKAKGGGGLFGVAVENRVRISIGPGPESIKAEKKKKAMQQLDFDVTPRELYLTGVPVGKAWDARKEAKRSIRIANYAADALSIRLEVASWDSRFQMPEGYEPVPELSWIRLKTDVVTVGAEEIGQASLIVTVPGEEKHKGRKYAAMIRSGLTTGFWLDAPVKVLIETEPSGP
jgi:hypothetical protein